MSPSSQLLSGLLLFGWVTSTAAEAGKTFLCTSGSGNEDAVCGTVTSLPNHVICNLEPAAVSLLSRDEALALAQRIRENCVITHRECRKAGEQGTVPFQVAASLVRKFEEFSPETLTSLGPVAVGLSVPQIESGIRDEDLLASLPSLSRVRGWNVHQAEALLSKLFSSGYQIQDGSSLAALGSLVAGLDHGRLQAVPPNVVLDTLQIPGFATQLEKVSPALKTAFVEKLIAATDGFKDLVEHVPDELVPYVPKSLLVPGGEFSIQDLSCKPWTPEQAAVFFEDVLKTVHNFSSLCASILHGFTCMAASNLDTERLQELAKVMKEKNVHLGKDQLLCLAHRLMRHGVSHDFHDYPKDLVLFVSPSDYGAIGSCKEYFALVGKANIDVLEKGSPQRKRLMAEALDCLKISGPHVNRENAKILGRLACDLGAEYFKASGKNLLKQLTECQSFSPDQVKAIQALLCSGNTPAGPPSEWSSSTLEDLSGLFHIFDRCVLQKIPASVLRPRLKCFLHTSHLPRKELASLAKDLRSLRHKRSTDSECQNVTDEMAQDELLPIYCTPEELHTGLGSEVFLRHLGILTQYAFTEEQLLVLKQKLDELYPDGYPASILPNLGGLSGVIGPEDIKKWCFNSTKTLASLLDNDFSPEVATAILHRYMDCGGPLNAEALKAIGTKYLCLLNPEQLQKIEENAFNCSSPLDPSGCNQTTKDILYAKAKRAFSDRHNSPQYYICIKPYLEGAPGEDLRALSKDNVNMDIATFTKMKWDSIMKLKPKEVKDLLGKHLPDLKTWENNSVVKDWIVRQEQRELDSLDIGVTGGIPEGYVTIMHKNNRPSEISGAAGGPTLHLFLLLLLTPLLTAFLS